MQGNLPVFTLKIIYCNCRFHCFYYIRCHTGFAAVVRKGLADKDCSGMDIAADRDFAADRNSAVRKDFAGNKAVRAAAQAERFFE